LFNPPRLVGLQVVPDCHDYKLVHRSDALEDLEALIAFIRAACLRKLAQEARSRGGRLRRNGLRGFYAGPIANSAAAEALTSVLITINRRHKIAGAGIRITGVPKA
jgi:hypothetical protein